MSQKSLVDELQQLQLAVELIELGARLQVLETETEISRARLVKLYKEVRGVSPPKGMLPFSTDWFMTWQPNLHASLFHGFYRRLRFQGVPRMDAFVKAYRFYLEHVGEEEPVLALTRAWTLVRFFESELLDLATCQTCTGHFVIHAHTPSHDYVCGICQPPSRAGKTAARRKAREQDMQREALAVKLG
ncbi:flagellar transcriptional regulator FlhC [Cobetia marina]|uniref:flagellar transcriptional regulator FlhC n=1 Tax=Cobetia marina TaxID=28258 RepID=UPI003A911E2F